MWSTALLQKRMHSEQTFLQLKNKSVNEDEKKYFDYLLETHNLGISNTTLYFVIISGIRL